MATTFQSTFPRGERLVIFLWYMQVRHVSIHVPTRGTTFGQAELNPSILGFNPRSHEGNDSIRHLGKGWLQKFQSTFPRGERRGEQSHEGCSVCFNPRSHEGNDASLSCYRRMWESFNPRSHEGNDPGCESEYRNEAVSIHVPTRGTTVLVDPVCK